MYTAPGHARRGVGRLILALCEQAARDAGFARVQLMGTMSGVPLYTACGYRAVEPVTLDIDGVALPMVRMEKRLD
jgi:GNAT superfamily N-acetyltransferase